MKSHVAALRSALSDKAHADPGALSERAMDLLLRLDAVQSSDPMIREGKRSISRELARILEFIDKVLVKEHQLSVDAIEIAGNGRHERSFVEDGRTESEGAEEVLRVAKKVSFLEDGNRSRVSFSGCNQFVEELGDAGYQNGQMKSLGREAARNGATDRMGSERFHDTCEDERSSESSVENSSRVEKFLSRNGRSGLSAPLPLQMEPRRKSTTSLPSLHFPSLGALQLFPQWNMVIESHEVMNPCRSIFVVAIATPHHYQYHHRAESSWWSHGPPARCHRFPLGELQPPPQPPSSREEIDPRYGVQKRLVPTGPNPLHN
ncbi:hypothetical protein OPV22_007623 [Ensete ventricosum]|uniref:BAG domain-containing protein n=1 Tax=Ensete ventricosum TaxID=4639 RepID=A0AAV8QET9_ENSVE|nr:hypothetical protein OPV22_007623 [Ensete ventricosum]